MAPTVDSMPELLKRVYALPEYRTLIQQYVPVILEQLSKDPEALEAVREHFERYGLSLGTGDRAVLSGTATAAWFLGGAAAGAVIGWFSEDDEKSK